MSAIPAGYKQTEVGLIPADWDVRRLDEVADFLDGRRRPVKDTDRAKMRGDIPYYGASGIVDYVNDYLFDDELILLGEDGENILSRNCRLAFRVSGKVWVNNHAHVLKPTSGNDIGYLSDFLESLNYDQYNTGTAQPKLNKQVCSAIPVATPPLPEQRAIAAALSDVDALLAKLDQLIAKKRDLKQAAMQQLLTGQTRLPGFSGEWEVKRLGELLVYEQPTKYLVSSSEYSDSNDVPVLTAGKTFVLGFTHETEGIFTDLPAMIFDDFTTATKYVTFPFKAKSSAMKILKPRNPSVNLRLVYEIMQLIDFKLGDHKRYWISEYSKLEVRMPESAEQTAIATVVSDMDAERAALESRRDKTRALKQGMMQELLTGRIRLV